MKRKIGELSIVRRKEQESVEPELKKMAARTVKAQWTNWQVLYLPSKIFAVKKFYFSVLFVISCIFVNLN